MLYGTSTLTMLLVLVFSASNFNKSGSSNSSFSNFNGPSTLGHINLFLDGLPIAI